MITIDVTMFIQIVNILILIVVMNAVLYRPVRTFLAKRAEKIAALNKEIETFNKNAELRMQDIEQKLSDARSKARNELDAMRGAAQASSAEKLGKIRKESDAMKAERVAAINEQFAGAGQELKGQLEVFANAMASKVLGRAL